MKEHIISNCFTELHQHLIDCKLTVPRELRKETGLWISTRVSRKAPTGDHKKGGLGPPH